MHISTRDPFSFEQTLAFIRRFPPCSSDMIVTRDSITGALSAGGRAGLVPTSCHTLQKFVRQS